jgi:hypothetical protein
MISPPPISGEKAKKKKIRKRNHKENAMSDIKLWRMKGRKWASQIAVAHCCLRVSFMIELLSSINTNDKTRMNQITPGKIMTLFRS